MENYLLLRVLKHIKLYVSLYVSLSIDHQNNHNRSKCVSHLFQSLVLHYIYTILLVLHYIACDLLHSRFTPKRRTRNIGH